MQLHIASQSLLQIVPIFLITNSPRRFSNSSAHETNLRLNFRFYRRQRQHDIHVCKCRSIIVWHNFWNRWVFTKLKTRTIKQHNVAQVYAMSRPAYGGNLPRWDMDYRTQCHCESSQTSRDLPHWGPCHCNGQLKSLSEISIRNMANDMCTNFIPSYSHLVTQWLIIVIFNSQLIFLSCRIRTIWVRKFKPNLSRDEFGCYLVIEWVFTAVQLLSAKKLNFGNHSRYSSLWNLRMLIFFYFFF